MHADQAVVETAPAVDDRRITGLLIDEQEEVVADHLHLGDRLLHGHRHRLVALLAHDDRALLPDGVVRLVRHGIHLGGRSLQIVQAGCPRTADGLRTVPVEPGLVSGPAKALLEASVGDVEGCVLVGGSGFRADHGPVGPRGQLHLERPVGQARVGLLGDLHVHPAQRNAELVDALEFAVDVLAESPRHLDMSSMHHDLGDVTHDSPPSVPPPLNNSR
ncbi:MAG: hypothetical protein IPG68_04505 [Micrococcales bacterium]|nr:hypothetical protein [Micrococcales bacterium]